jgi:hypothetical protein
MNAYSKQRFAFWTLIGIGALILYGAFVLFAHVAHADPPIAGDWHQATSPGITPTDVAAWLGLALAVAIGALRLIAPRTKATWDDEWLARLEALEGVVHRPPGPPPDPVPAIVSGTIETKDGAS